MEQNDKDKFTILISQLESLVGILQYQVLNNLDTYVSGKQDIDLKALDTFVKRPIMQAATKLKSLKLGLLKQANGPLTTRNSEGDK
jgi:hypothetical protein